MEREKYFVCPFGRTRVTKTLGTRLDYSRLVFTSDGVGVGVVVGVIRELMT